MAIANYRLAPRNATYVYGRSSPSVSKVSLVVANFLSRRKLKIWS